MMLLPGMLPGSPQQGAAAYPYAVSMGVVPGQPANWYESNRCSLPGKQLVR
jgi:hypothetical protein